MREGRLEFYDPLYETIVFQRGLPSKLSFLTQDNSIDPRSIIKTVEFARLTFLRQNGLAWLMFPSATYTRFEHSIGCWGLGRLAESLIKVRTSESQCACSLSFWLKSKELRSEFYLGLLCHGIGHGPLSNILEQNKEFLAGLKANGITQLNYQSRGAALLEGVGKLSEIWQQIASYRYGVEIRNFDNAKQHLSSLENTVCMPAVCYFMTRDTRYLERCFHSHKEHLNFVKELVNGLLAVRRLDHYARDSYFSGLRQYAINLREFLNNLYITVPSPATDTIHLSVSETCLPYAAGVLLKKRHGLFTTFRNPEVISLHVMANWALSKYLKIDQASRASACMQIAFMEDDQFLETITSSAHRGCRYMGQRIRIAKPYTYVGKWANIEQGRGLADVRNSLDDLTETTDDKPPEVLLHDESNFREASNQLNNCFSPQRILIENTNTAVAEHPNYKNNFEHLQEAAKVNYLYIFVRDERQKEDLKSKIDSMLGG